MVCMPRLRPPVPTTALTELAGAQGGVVSRRQVMDLGMTEEQIARALKAGGWRDSQLPGVYLAFTGPIPYLSRCWAALLYAGPGAALGLETAAWVWGLRDDPPDDVHVMIETGRRIRKQPQPGLRVHLRLHLARRRHPSRLPPVVRLEETVLDLIARPGSTEESVIDVVLRACQRRLTRVDRLRAAADRRAKLRHRRLLSDVLSDVTDGVQSALERRYLRDVDQAHGLPRAERNTAEPIRTSPGRWSYRDVRYVGYRLVVELDGQAAHPADQRERDDLRDNSLIEAEGTRTLRYGWRSVTTRACETAEQVGHVLNSCGWNGGPRRCGPTCRLPAS